MSKHGFPNDVYPFFNTGFVAHFITLTIGNSTVWIKLKECPDINVIMEYVYGPVIPSSEKLHALSHVINDGLSNKAKTSIEGIEIVV